jgi:hypothetical protein
MLATRVADVLDLLAVVIAGGLMLIIEAGRPGTARILLALAFVFFVPGRAIVSNWPQLALWSEAAMAMIFSLAVLSLAATITLWAHQWHPLGLFEVEAAVSIAGLIAGTARRHARGTGTRTRRVAS